MRHGLTHWYFLILLAFIGCVEVIDFETGPSPTEVIIYGQVNNSLAYDQRIRVSLTTTTNRPPLNVGDASVTVIDEFGTRHPYQYREDLEYYLPVTPFQGQPGIAYQVQVTIDDKTYASNFQRMPDRTATDSTYFAFERRSTISNSGIEFLQWFVSILTDSQVPDGDPLYIKRDVLQTFAQEEMFLPLSNFPFYSPKVCWISETWIGPNILLYDGSVVSAPSVFGSVVGELPLDNSFNALRGFGVVQSSFSKEALDYWVKVDAVSNRVGSIFEVPPAPIPGNITNVDDPTDIALGFFEVAKVDTTGTFITGDDVPVFLGFNGNFVDCGAVSLNALGNIPFMCFPCLEDLGIDPACYNCLVIPNSSAIKPKFLE